MNMIPFHDISYAQGAYNMAANTDPMVMMKASGFYTGSLQPYIDSQLDRNYALAKQYSKIPFMYHFFVPAVAAETQAAWFLKCVSPLAVGDGYALDVEIDGPNLVQDVLIFVTRHHANTGCWPWVYIDRYLRQKYNWSAVFALCSEWIAAPDVSYDAVVPGVGVYVAQQGPIVNGVDTDEYFGTLESLKSYTYGYVKPAAAPAPQPVPTPTPEPTVAPGTVVTPSQPSSNSTNTNTTTTSTNTQTHQINTPPVTTQDSGTQASTSYTTISVGNLKQNSSNQTTTQTGGWLAKLWRFILWLITFGKVKK